MFKILDLSGGFYLLGLVKIFSAWGGQKKLLGCFFARGDQYPGWHYFHFCCEAFWRYFRAYFFMFLYFLRTMQYFIMKFCTDVLGSTLMVTSPKKYVLFSSAGGHFGVFLGPFQHIMFLCFLRTIQYFIMKFCRCYSDGHYTNKKLIKTFSDHVLLCCQAIFGPILAYGPLFRENHSIFSHENV